MTKPISKEKATNKPLPRMTPGGKLPVSYDFVFKQIFGVEKHKKVLLFFLNSLFKGKPHIKNLMILNGEMPKDIKDGRSCRLDIKAETDNGTKINIEIQCSDEGSVVKRSLYYSSKIIATDLKESEDFELIPNVISIFITNYKETERISPISIAQPSYLPTETDPFEVATDMMTHVLIELPKVNEKRVEKSDSLSVWLAFIKNPDIISKDVLETYPEVNEAMDTLSYLSQDREVRLQYEALIKTREDEANRIAYAKRKSEEKGFKKGAMNKAKETAVNALNMGLSVEQVCKITGLTEEEIQELQ